MGHTIPSYKILMSLVHLRKNVLTLGVLDVSPNSLLSSPARRNRFYIIYGSAMTFPKRLKVIPPQDLPIPLNCA